MPRLSLSLLAALALACGAAGQERPALLKRGVHVVKHAPAQDLADRLSRRFKDATIQAAPPGTGNALLVSASPALFAEITRAIEALDHPRLTVAVEVFVVALPAKVDKDSKGPDEKDLSGSLEEVARQLEALKKKGQVQSVKRLECVTLEDQQATLHSGVNTPYVARVITRPRGFVSRAITYGAEGTRIQVTPQVGTDRVVLLDISVQDTRLRHFKAPAAGEKEKAAPAAEPIETSLESRFSVPAGKAVVAKGATVRSKSGEGRTLLVVGVRVAESDGK